LVPQTLLIDYSGSYPLLTSPMPNPALDNCQNWEVLSGSESNGYTTAVIRRALVTADQNDRIIMSSGSQRIVYAWGTTSDSVTYHSSRRGAGDPKKKTEKGKEKKDGASQSKIVQPIFFLFFFFLIRLLFLLRRH
jgi:hypothetical protein